MSQNRSKRRRREGIPKTDKKRRIQSPKDKRKIGAKEGLNTDMIHESKPERDL